MTLDYTSLGGAEPRTRRGPAPLRRAVGVSEWLFSSALLAAERLQRNGLVINESTIRSEVPHANQEKLSTLMASQQWAMALEDRGIASSSSSALSPDQLAALSIYMDMEVSRTHREKLRAAGVPSVKWQGWLRQPEFARQLQDLSNEVLQQSVPIAKQRVAEGVDKGDIKFIEMALQLTGNDPKQQYDVQSILMQVFSIIDEEVRDPDILARIGGKVQSMMAGGQGMEMKRQIVTLAGAAPREQDEAATMAPERPAFPIQEG